MITFVGAGPGAEDLITVRGQRLLQEADIIVYAGSLVNPGLLSMAGADCEIYNSAKMTLEEVMDVMTAGERAGKKVVRLHTVIPVCTARSASRWMRWRRRAFPMRYARASARSAERRRRWARNIRSRASPSRW